MLKTPETAVLAESNETVPVEKIKIGTLILVCAGEKIPLDGEVIKGKAAGGWELTNRWIETCVQRKRW